MWTNKYTPKKMDDYVSSIILDDISKNHLLNGKCMILSGPSGCGKTSLVYALAGTYGYEVIEFNASMDFKLNKFIKAMTSIGKVVVLLDELDKPIKPLMKYIEKTRVPIFVCTNNLNGVKKDFKDIDNKILVYSFNSPSTKMKCELIAKILSSENIRVSPLIIDKIVNMCNDFRSCINVLEDYIETGELIKIDNALGMDCEKRTIIETFRKLFDGDFKTLPNDITTSNVIRYAHANGIDYETLVKMAIMEHDMKMVPGLSNVNRSFAATLRTKGSYVRYPTR